MGRHTMDLVIVGDTATLTVTGAIDDRNEEQLRHTLWEAAQSDPECLIIDLREAGTFGSTGVNALVWTWHLLRDSATTIDVKGCAPVTQQVLNICRVAELERVFVIPRP